MQIKIIICSYFFYCHFSCLRLQTLDSISGTVAEGKEERSQMKNKDIAMKKLKQR